MLPYLKDTYGNASSVHAYGRKTKVAVEAARAHVAALLNADPSEIVFTSGGTEADNMAIHIGAGMAAKRGRPTLVSSKAEHQAVLQPLANIDSGARTRFMDVLPSGAIALDRLEVVLADDVGFVSLMHANNETGVLNPIEHIASRTAEAGILFHSDTVQSAGKLPLDVRSTPIDFASLSAHKIHGPKGVGALFVKAGLDVAPFMLGGAQERGRRGGTENVPAIVGFGEAARLALEERTTRMDTWRQLRAELAAQLTSQLPAAVLNGEGAETIPNIVSISLPHDSYPIDGEMLLMNLDLEGIAVSSGSACTAGSVEPSHVMRAIGHDAKTAKATLRVSFDKDTTAEELHTFVRILANIVSRMMG